MVSVIVTSYKRPAEIVMRAVDSILNQTYEDLEVLVIDDNPNGNDFSVKLRETFSNIDRVRYIKQNGNKGACAARNLGIEMAAGEYIGFLDDDDIWDPQKLEYQLKRFENAPEEVAMVYCLGDVVYWGTNPLKVEEYYTTRLFKDEITFADQLKYDYCGSTSQALIKKDCLVNLGGFDESLPARQDYEMWLRISKNYRIWGVNKVLFHYIQHEMEQITKNPRKALTGYQIVYQKYKEDYKKNPDAYIGYLERVMNEIKDDYKFLFWRLRIRKHLIILKENINAKRKGN